VNSKKRDLTKGPIKDHILAIAIPAIIGFFFQTMYNVIDTFYAGLISTEAQAALSLSFPIYFIILAMGSGIGIAASALISNSIGEKKDEGKFCSQALSYALITSLIVMIIGFIISPTLFEILGAEAGYLQLSLDYMNFILLGTPFFLLVMTITQSLTAQGDSKSFRNVLIVGFLLNLILNPVFMFGYGIIPAFGISGIAIATVLIQIVKTFYLAIQLKKTNILKGKTFKDYLPNINFYKEITEQAIPASLNMMTVAIGIFIITYFISIFGKSAVAAYGIATRIEQIFLLPTIGLNFAILALVGQNNGAKLFERVKESYIKTVKYGVIIMTFGTIALFFFANQLMSIFTSDLEVINYGGDYLRIAAFMTWGYVILFQTVSMLQGLKKPMFALWIGLFRQIVAPIIVFWALIEIMGFGIFGIWYGLFAIIWISVGITLWYGLRIFNKLILKKCD
jgi:putative MATE family efflux protein